MVFLCILPQHFKVYSCKDIEGWLKAASEGLGSGKNDGMKVFFSVDGFFFCFIHVFSVAIKNGEDCSLNSYFCCLALLSHFKPEPLSFSQHS